METYKILSKLTTWSIHHVFLQVDEKNPVTVIVKHREESHRRNRIVTVSPWTKNPNASAMTTMQISIFSLREAH